MQLLWILVLISILYSAVSAAPKNEEPRRPGHGHHIDCNDVVAFSAATKGKQGGMLQKNHIIHFETLLYDRYTGYNKETGIFTCPCAGLYQITFTVSGENSFSKFSLRKRRSSSSNTWTNLLSTEEKGGSYTVFLELEFGEEIGIMIDSGSTSGGISYKPSHTFSGYRIKRK